MASKNGACPGWGGGAAVGAAGCTSNTIFGLIFHFSVETEDYRNRQRLLRDQSAVFPENSKEGGCKLQ